MLFTFRPGKDMRAASALHAVREGIVHDTKWPIGPLHGADLVDSHFDGSMQLLRCLRPRHPLSVPRAKAVPTLANPVDAPCWVRLCSSVSFFCD